MKNKNDFEKTVKRTKIGGEEIHKNGLWSFFVYQKNKKR